MPVMPAAEMPPVTPSQERVMDLLMVTPPKPPGSRQLISPPAAVFEMAPANVLHGAVRLQGLASSPTPETQVRVACACACVAGRAKENAINIPNSISDRLQFVIVVSPVGNNPPA